MNKCIVNNVCNNLSLDYKISRICLCDYGYFLSKYNVTGIALGYKEVNGINTNMKCITVFVEEKLPLNQLKPFDQIPKYYKGICTDVFESGAFYIQSLNKKIRPTLGGYSISNEEFSRTGTLGCLVTDGNYKYILGNNHILASSNKAKIGSSILQPSKGDGGVLGVSTVATLSKFIPLDFQGKNNFVDSAIAKVTSPNIALPNIALVGPPKGIKDASLSQPVMKVGRTSELTKGRISQMHAVMLLKASSTMKYIMIDQIITERMSDEGDSGSILLDSNNFALGQLVGASSNKSIFTPIKTVLSALNVSLITG
ncbi:hypothetical protein Z959_10515 [Clostridium novyi B str. ATCC 27606]|uniref:Nal1 N-terminal domain-containing protein n=1 Tax=Clostridium novyi B str. ATCC 27606 TaxID=1443123 RepID=A0AA40IW76_CLONO|nr:MULTISPECIES: hypothetical protein [Clostridium]KEI14482.1 hypothetical protein Z958_12350 [Clostridium novyi B str. NCTC 9691]KEI18328.1 hypothetical protein Z959_10515 [Clostridium novyi B str. ATCC 27606]CAG7838833.1 hypothetical protein CLOHAE12215_00200 [Clostridium haemolyticum]